MAEAPGPSFQQVSYGPLAWGSELWASIWKVVFNGGYIELIRIPNEGPILGVLTRAGRYREGGRDP